MIFYFFSFLPSSTVFSQLCPISPCFVGEYDDSVIFQSNLCKLVSYARSAIMILDFLAVIAALYISMSGRWLGVGWSLGCKEI
jgi:hypothetical protein